jgi:hypothetical protein
MTPHLEEIKQLANEEPDSAHLQHAVLGQQRLPRRLKFLQQALRPNIEGLHRDANSRTRDTHMPCWHGRGCPCPRPRA